jgi:hypothetical protein
MTKRGNPKFFQVLVRQIRQDARIDVILSKALSVLPETELFEPVGNLLHRGHQADFSLPALLDRRHTEFILPAARLKSAFQRVRCSYPALWPSPTR